MKKLLLLLVVLASTFTFAQNNGITYQAVIYSTNGESVPGVNNSNSPLTNKAICLQFSIGDGNSSTEYQEKVTVTTDEYGMVNLVIGTGTQTGGFATSFNTINWAGSQKYLKVSVDQSGNCFSFELISNQILTYVPYALAANSAASVTGVVGIANGGTNASTVVGAKTNLLLQNVDNTTDLNKPLSTATQTALATKVDKVTGKELSSNDYTTVEKTKLAAITGTNTGDQDLSSYATTTAIALKANTADLTTGLATKVDKVSGKDLSSNDYTTVEKTKLAAITGTNTGDQDLSLYATNTNLALKANTVDLTAGLATKVDKVTGKELSSNDYTTDEKTKLAAITGTNTGDQDLSLFATATSIALKANTADLTAGLATKVDKVTGKDLSSNDYTTVEKTKLAAITGTNTGDQTTISGNAGTATKLATPININGVAFDGSADISIAATAGNITGIIPVANGGTGQTTVSGILSTLGFAGNNIAIGGEAGTPNQGVNSGTIAIGGGAGRGNQGAASVAIGYVSGDQNQGSNSVAIGANSAQSGQGTQAVAIGFAAGQNGQGAYSVALGSFAGNVQAANSIALNATGAVLNPSTTGFFVAPIRNTTATSTVLYYDTTTKEVTSGTAASGVDLTTNQTIAGSKTFSADIVVNGITAGKGSGAISSNTAFGLNALNANTTGSNNTANGTNSLQLNTTGYGNTATGLASLASNSTGSENTANGVASLAQNSTGSQNTANGVNALYYNTTGNNNTANGLAALEGNTLGSDNTANGSRSLFSNKTGYNNTATGSNSLKSNIIGFGNTANGVSSLQSNAFGNENTAIGNNSLFRNTFGSGNTANGVNSIYSNTTGVVNTANGANSLYSNTLGYGNTATGYNSLSVNTDGFHNTAIGNQANVGSGSLNNATAIGNGAIVDASNTIQLGNTNVTDVKTSGTISAGVVTYPNSHGSAGQVLTTNGSGSLTWSSPTSINTSDFVDVTTNQTIAGKKTFSADVSVNGLTIGKGTGQNGDNTAIGAGALNSSNASGTRNTAVGVSALLNYAGTSFDNNTGVGYYNMVGLTTGGGNTSVGAETMFNVASGSNNTGIGNQSLISITGNNNVGVGTRSGDGLTTGSNNTFLGTQAKTTSIGAAISNATAIGYEATVESDDTIQLGNTNVTIVKTSGALTTGNITYPTSAGTAGQVLTADGSGAATWETVGGGAPTFKQSRVIQSSSTATADSEIEVGGMAFRYNKQTQKIEVKQTTNLESEWQFYNTSRIVNGIQQSLKQLNILSTSQWSEFGNANANDPLTISGYYQSYEFELTPYIRGQASDNHSFNIKVLLDGWGIVTLRVVYY